MIFNSQLIIEALEKHTGLSFKQTGQHEPHFVSSRFLVSESGFFMFDVSRHQIDNDTGIYNEIPIGEDLTLADVIDALNKEMGKL